jgi:hypothetical protein
MSFRLTDGYAFIREPNGTIGFSPPPTITNILFAAAQLGTLRPGLTRAARTSVADDLRRSEVSGLVLLVRCRTPSYLHFSGQTAEEFESLGAPKSMGCWQKTHEVTAAFRRWLTAWTHQSGSNRYSILSYGSPSYGVPDGRVSRVFMHPPRLARYPLAMPTAVP